jgi:hypothetical protein
MSDESKQTPEEICKDLEDALKSWDLRYPGKQDYPKWLPIWWPRRPPAGFVMWRSDELPSGWICVEYSSPKRHLKFHGPAEEIRRSISECLQWEGVFRSAYWESLHLDILGSLAPFQLRPPSELEPDPPQHDANWSWLKKIFLNSGRR